MSKISICDKYIDAFHRFTLFAPVDLEGFAGRVKMSILYVDGDVFSFARYLQGYTEVQIPNTWSKSKQRFEIAKGLAMTIYDWEKDPNGRKLEDLTLEIILPEKLVQEYCAINECSPEFHQEIADYFKVSLRGFRFRLKQLNLYMQPND